MQIEIRGLQKLGNKVVDLAGAGAKVRALLDRATKNFANDAVTRIKRDYLTGPRPEKLGVVSGRLRSSIRYTITNSGKLIAMRFGTDVPYARTHEEGTGPFDIRPVRAKALAFKGRDGNMVFRKRVRHPGMRKRPFLRPGVEDAIPGFVGEVEKGLGDIASGGDGK